MSLFAVDIGRAESWALALDILYQDLPSSRRRKQIDQLLLAEDAAGQAIRDGGLLVCRQGGEIVGAMLTLNAPGRVTMAWPPRAKRSASDDEERDIALALLHRARDEAAKKESRFVQLLADELSGVLDKAIKEVGFFHLTQLVYARRSIDPNEQAAAPLPEIEFVGYRDDLRDELLGILNRSYQQSMDCPELTGLRSLEDVFASHQGHGDFLPERWLLVRQQGEWVGCLLMSAAKGEKVIEISYVAVLPEARGHGLGRVLTREAIGRAVREGAEAVVLAVDGRNMPALAMYEDEGFVPWDIRDVYLLVLDPADGRMVRD